MAERTETVTQSGEDVDEFGISVDWGDEPTLEAPSCDLSNPESCESCQ